MRLEFPIHIQSDLALNFTNVSGELQLWFVATKSNINFYPFRGSVALSKVLLVSIILKTFLVLIFPLFNFILV